MGLDMYLTGHEYFDHNGRREGVLTEKVYHLGYWRKHYELNSAFLALYGSEADMNGRGICFSHDDLLNILGKIKTKEINPSNYWPEEDVARERLRDIKTIEKALKWVKRQKPNTRRRLEYLASW